MTSISAQWQRVVRLDHQPILRNLLITQGYHELSRGFARMLGPDNVTWFSFASWSSKTVGGFLQNQHLPRALRSRLEVTAPALRQQLELPFRCGVLAAERELAGGTFDAAFVAAVHDMRRFLAKGNTEVFGELAPVFVRFLEMFDRDREPDDSKLARFLSTLQAGSSAPDRVASDPRTRELELVARGGQALLREAVRQFYHAKFEPDAKRKAERILLANAHIGVHEQTRLQTYIRGALDAPVRTLFFGAAQHAIAKRVGHGVLGAVGSREFEPCASGQGAVARGATWVSLRAHTMFRRFATDRLLTLELPDSSVRLGRDLTAAPGHPLFPRMLENLEHPELGSLFARYGSSPSAMESCGSGASARSRVSEVRPRGPKRSLVRVAAGASVRQDDASRVDDVCVESQSMRQVRRGSAACVSAMVATGTAAEDWASLDQRMRFILELFRSRQQNQRLLEPTFSESQVEVLRRGMVPEGLL